MLNKQGPELIQTNVMQKKASKLKLDVSTCGHNKDTITTEEQGCLSKILPAKNCTQISPKFSRPETAPRSVLKVQQAILQRKPMTHLDTTQFTQMKNATSIIWWFQSSTCTQCISSLGFAQWNDEVVFRASVRMWCKLIMQSNQSDKKCKMQQCEWLYQCLNNCLQLRVSHEH